MEQGKSVTEVIGVTEPIYYQRQARYGGLKLSQVSRLKLLEQENSRLRALEWATSRQG